MLCHNCGYENPAGVRFCGMCGTRLVKTCPTCGAANPLEFQFCGQCGIRFDESARDVAERAGAVGGVEAKAPSMTVPIGEKGPARDPSSPQLIQLEGERRPVTVILADVSRSTDLLERIGTERWVQIMNHVLQILESEVYRYGGEVDQFRGDGLVALFGATLAREDDPERAVLCALAMQESIQSYAEGLRDKEDIELQLRIGVNSGEAIVANIGDRTQHSEDTAMGEALTLAARMEAAAVPSTVLVSEHTYQLVQAQFEWEALGEMSLKGLSMPVAVYRPIKPCPDAERSRRLEAYGLPTLLVGRQEQFEILLGCLRDLKEDRGGIVLVTGDEGMGKSHLVAKVRESVGIEQTNEGRSQGQEITWLQARCRSHDESWPYSMWFDLLQRWLGVSKVEDELQTRDQLRQKAQDLWGDQLGQHYPFLVALLSVPLEDEFADRIRGLRAESLRQHVFASVQAWVRALSRRGPLVLAFEDVHWVDATSLSLVRHCLPLCERESVQWWFMFRLDRTTRMWDFRHFVETEYPHRLTSINLSPLTEAQSAEMLDRMIGDDVLPVELHELIVAKAEGNPYYIEELVHSLTREGALVHDAWSGQWRATRAVTSLQLPDTLRSLLLARIDDLALEERRVLQMAAVVGMVFWYNVLLELVDDATTLSEDLSALQRAGLVRERGRVPDLGTEYVFKSNLIRDVAYEGILQAQRIICHRQIADYLAKLFGQEVLAQYYGLVAYHYRQASERRKELFYTLSAAEHAQSIYANAEALAYYERSIELLDTEDGVISDVAARDWYLEALQGLGQVCFGMGDVARAEAYFRQAIAMGKELDLRTNRLVRLHYWLGEVLFWQNRYEEQIEVGKAGLVLLGDRTGTIEEALMNQIVAIAHFELGHGEAFRRYTYRTAEFLRDLSYVQELRPAYNHVSKAYRSAKKIDEAMEWLQTLQDRAEAHHDLRALGEAHYLAGDVLADQGDLQAALAREQMALDLFRSIEDVKHESWCLGNASWASLMLGDVEQAGTYVEQAVALARTIGNRRDIGWACWRAGQVALCEGDVARALMCFENSANAFAAVGRRRSEMRALYAVGRVHLAREDKEQALAYLQRAAIRAEPEAIRQDTFSLASELAALERAYESAEEFRAFCMRFRQEQVGLEDSPLGQWFLEPADLSPPPKSEEVLSVYDDFERQLSSDWAWLDVSGKSSICIQNGVTIQAARGTDMWLVNLRAPRIVRPACGDWTMQTICEPDLHELTGSQPILAGGLVAWRDKTHYVRLDAGAGGDREIMLMGCISNRDVVFGRGRLPTWLGTAGRVFLCLRRIGSRIGAFCSVDGDTWFSVGEIDWGEGEVQVGMYAVGLKDPLIYPGRCADQTMMRFGSFWLWQGKE